MIEYLLINLLGGFLFGMEERFISSEMRISVLGILEGN